MAGGEAERRFEDRIPIAEKKVVERVACDNRTCDNNCRLIAGRLAIDEHWHGR